MTEATDYSADLMPGDIVKFAVVDWPDEEVIEWLPSGRVLHWIERAMPTLSYIQHYYSFKDRICLVDCGDLFEPKEVRAYQAKRSRHGWLVSQRRPLSADEYSVMLKRAGHWA